MRKKLIKRLARDQAIIDAGVALIGSIALFAKMPMIGVVTFYAVLCGGVWVGPIAARFRGDVSRKSMLWMLIPATFWTVVTYPLIKALVITVGLILHGFEPNVSHEALKFIFVLTMTSAFAFIGTCRGATTALFAGKVPT